MEPKSDDQILALYDWSTGDCFRCANKAVDTTLVAVMCPPADGRQEVRACQRCVLALEAMRRRAAQRRSEPYEPGRLAHRVE
jgi:hypothetical protein